MLDNKVIIISHMLTNLLNMEVLMGHYLAYNAKGGPSSHFHHEPLVKYVYKLFLAIIDLKSAKCGA